MRARRALAVTVLALAALIALPTIAVAHPLGNFTINVYDGIQIAPASITIDHVVDMAEIPTYQRRQEIDVDRDGRISPAEAAEYATSDCEEATKTISVTLDHRAVALAREGSSVTFPPGAGGLPTLRLTCGYVGRVHLRDGAVIAVGDEAYDGHIGWHEMTAVGDRATLVRSDVPSTSISQRLTRYPADKLRSPLDVRAAHLMARPGGDAASQAPPVAGSFLPRGVDRATRAFTDLVAGHRFTASFALLAVLAAVALGAAHALAPGHGKTVTAAYLVGQRGSRRDAITIAAAVTATHTAGVLALAVVLAATKALAPEQLYPWLGMASGLMLLAIGVSLLRNAVRRRRSAGGTHAHEHDHPHPSMDRPRARSLLALGFAGGVVPSPSALVVLLAATALGRMWFGIALVVAYGIGMAAMLTGAGLALVRARGFVERHSRFTRAATALPIAAASAIAVVGAVLAARGVAAV